MSPVARAAAAKLTLSLRVTGVRDDGFHELDAFVVSVAPPADRLTLTLTDEPAVAASVSGPAAAGVPADARNLAVRAVETLRPPGRGAHLVLEKHIPAGAGLGGGSADAAAALHLACELFALEADPATLRAHAAALGSDVPFCVAGGAAWMRGRGEVLEPVAALDPFAVLVAVPPLTCSTPAVYRAWDELGGPAGARAVPAPAAVTGHVAELVNDLEPAAEAVTPGLAEFRAALEQVLGAPPLLAGSGSAYAACFEDPARAEHLAERVRAALPGVGVFAGSTVGAGSAPAPP